MPYSSYFLNISRKNVTLFPRTILITGRYIDLIPSAELCDLECGEHGACEAGRCVCDQGWYGDTCGVQTCDPRCSQHGECDT